MTPEFTSVLTFVESALIQTRLDQLTVSIIESEIDLADSQAGVS